MGELTRDLLDKLYTGSDTGFGAVDLTGLIIDVNEAALNISRYSRSELVNVKKYYDITPDEFFDYEADIVKELLMSERSIKYEKEIIRKDGEIVPLLVNSICLRDNEGNPYALAGTVQEITGYKFCRDGLLENENKFLALLDITPDVVCELGTGGTIIYVSPNSADKLTYSPSDLRGREFFSFVHGNDVKRVMTKMTCSLKSASTEYTSCLCDKAVQECSRPTSFDFCPQEVFQRIESSSFDPTA